jgi:hypothetical protein
MNITVEITEQDLKRLILAELRQTMPESEIVETDVTIEVKSKQNYRSEWEPAAFRATVKKHA